MATGRILTLPIEPNTEAALAEDISDHSVHSYILVLYLSDGQGEEELAVDRKFLSSQDYPQ